MTGVEGKGGLVCPLCSGGKISQLFELRAMPVLCHVLRHLRDEALNCVRGDIQLSHCQACGFIFNGLFDSSLLSYGGEYENSLHFSGVFQDYALTLSRSLIEKHDLRGRDIVEVGCGQGDFLRLICDLGSNRGVGFDPSRQEKDAAEGSSGMRIICDRFSETYADTPCDFLICRQVLEHLERPREMLNLVRRLVPGRGSASAFFEVPNAERIFSEGFLWDVIYEHCSYFTKASLAFALQQSGFSVIEMGEAFFGQFLFAEARGAVSIEESDFSATEPCSDFAAGVEKFFAQVSFWNGQFSSFRECGKKVVIWGAGSKAITFLNLLNAGGVEFVVDVNPRKIGKYVPGAGQTIVSPEFLRSYQPDVIVIMNAAYYQEIEAQVRMVSPRSEILIV